MTTLFETPDQVTIPDQAYEALVGEGKKFKDNEALAKSVFHKDAFIETLKNESKSKDARVAELEDELKTRQTISEFVNLMKNEPSGDIPTPPSPGSPPGQPQQDLDKLLDEKFAQRQREQETREKLAYVREELKKLHGDEYQAEVLKKAQELGVDAKFLEAVAVQSPRAFLELVKPKAPGTPPTGLPSSSVRLPSSGTKRDLAWYKKQMQQDRSLRTNEAFQIQMHKDAQAQGESFFN